MAKNETSTVIFNGEKANATLKQLEAEARKLNAKLRQENINSKEFGDKEKEFQMITVGLIGFGASLVGLIKGNTKLEDSPADIRKTTLVFQ